MRPFIPCKQLMSMCWALFWDQWPIFSADAIKAVEITSRYPRVHGAPVHLGNPVRQYLMQLEVSRSSYICMAHASCDSLTDGYRHRWHQHARFRGRRGDAGGRDSGVLGLWSHPSVYRHVQQVSVDFHAPAIFTDFGVVCDSHSQTINLHYSCPRTHAGARCAQWWIVSVVMVLL